MELDRGVSAKLSVTNGRVNAECFDLRFCIHAVRRVSRSVSPELCLASDLKNESKYAHSSAAIDTTQQDLTLP